MLQRWGCLKAPRINICKELRRGLFLCQLVPDAAQLDGADTEVRSNMILRNLLLDAGKFLLKYSVPLGGIEQNDFQFLFFFFHEIVLRNLSRQALQIRETVVMAGNGAVVRCPDDAVGQCLLRQQGGGAGEQRRITPDARRPHKKLLVVFLPFVVGEVSANNARFEKSDFSGDIILMDKVMLLGQRRPMEKRFQHFPSFLF